MAEKHAIATPFGTVLVTSTKGELFIRIPRAPNNTICFEKKSGNGTLNMDLQTIETILGADEAMPVGVIKSAILNE